MYNLKCNLCIRQGCMSTSFLQEISIASCVKNKYKTKKKMKKKSNYCLDEFVLRLETREEEK